MQFKTTKLFF